VLRTDRLLGVVAAVSCVAAGATAPACATAPGWIAAPRHPMMAAPARLAAPAKLAAPANAKKGVSAWTFTGVRDALAKSGASWYYTWAPGHPGISSPAGVQFVPMIWGAGSITAATLRQVRREGHYLLGFNEPDNAGQSNMTVSQALHLWPKLIATRMSLGSPAVATGAATPGGWLDEFMRGAVARHYRVNFIAVHWYGGDFATRAAVRQLRAYLRAIHARYHLPIWLTEFALIRFGSTVSFPTARQQAAFVTSAASMLEGLSYVQRYAWFALPATPGDGTAGLFRAGAIATAAGRAFEAVDAERTGKG
jgi:Glycosyl hydrolase catalytic core